MGKLPFVWAALLTMSAAAFAQETMKIEGAWARRAPMMQGDAKSGSGNGAIYAKIVNAGKQADALVAVRTDASESAEIHESYRSMGMMMMRRIDKLDVPAGKDVEMKPGGYHIMLLNLKRDLKAGEAVDVTLQFKNAGAIAVKAEIK